MIQIGSLFFDKSILLITGALILLVIVIFIVYIWLEENSYFLNSTSGYSNPSPINARFDEELFDQNGICSAVLYHGTPRKENVLDMIKHGFIIGDGDAKGRGFYLADLPTARQYARNGGMILKVLLQVPWDQIAQYESVAGSSHFSSWRSSYGSNSLGDDISNYVVEVLKKRFLRIGRDSFVALAQETSENERVVFEGLTIIGILDAYGNPE